MRELLAQIHQLWKDGQKTELEMLLSRPNIPPEIFAIGRTLSLDKGLKTFFRGLEAY